MTDVAGDRGPWLYRLLAGLLRPVVLGLVRPAVTGLAHVPSSGPAIVCANHLSLLDPLLVPLLLDRPVVYLAKQELFAPAPLRWFFSGLGVVPVQRDGGSAAAASLERGVEVLRDGGLLSLFPEGTRSPDGQLYRAKTGPVRLAGRTGAPIVPVGLIGTRDVLPPHGRLPRLGAPVRVRVGAPLTIDPDADVRAEADRMMQAIRALSGQRYVDEYARPVARARVSDDGLDALGRPGRNGPD